MRKNRSWLKKGWQLPKRERFILVSLLLTVGLVTTQLVDLEHRFQMVAILSLFSFILCIWALKDELSGVSWFILPSLPTLFTAAVSLFYFLLPVRWLTRLPTAFIYAICIYALLLTGNIFNVSAERSIQLVRAARSVGLLLTLVVAFLFFNTLFAFRLYPWHNLGLSFFICFPLSLYSLWSIKLTKDKIPKEVLVYTFIVSLVISELAFFLSLWPLTSTLAALFLTAVKYTLVSLFQQRLLGQLYKSVVRDLVFVSGGVFVLIFLATRWGG